MFYSRAYLEQRFKEEKLRCYRTGCHFSAVLFNPFELVSDGHKGNEKIHALVRLLDDETRETDVKGWWDRNRIAVFLLDTSPENALVFIDKVISKIQGWGDLRDESIRRASFEVFSFPNTPRPRREGEDDKEGGYSGRLGNNPNGDRGDVSQFISFPDRDFPTEQHLKKCNELFRRVLDVVVAVSVLIVSAPLLLFCGILIRLDSPGPVFYRQTRVGKGGKYFTFLKFRSMRHDADEGIHKRHIESLMNHEAGLACHGNLDAKTYKLLEDERVTGFGRFLRKTSMDELPQFINLLKGDLTLIGPRPHPVYEVGLYDLWQTNRLEIKPGITGLGQVYGRFDTEYEDVYRLDLQYLRRRSLNLDLKILLRTIPLVLSRRGAL